MRQLIDDILVILWALTGYLLVMVWAWWITRETT